MTVQELRDLKAKELTQGIQSIVKENISKSDFPFTCVDLDEIYQLENNIRELLDHPRKNQPIIIYLFLLVLYNK